MLNKWDMGQIPDSSGYFGIARFFFVALFLFQTLIAQNVNDYLGPKQKVPGNPQLIRVQVLVSDDPNPQGAQIVRAEFHRHEIPLKPRDIYGFRGQASFQTPPGKYKLKWTGSEGSFCLAADHCPRRGGPPLPKRPLDSDHHYRRKSLSLINSP